MVIICGESDFYLFLETVLLSHACYQAMAVPAVRLCEEVKLRRPALAIFALDPDRVALGMMPIFRRDAACRDTSLLVTAPRGCVSRDEILRCGANGVIWKDFTPVAFMREVDRLALVAPRRTVDTPVSLTRVGREDMPVSARAINVSETGILVKSFDPLPLGSLYFVQVAVPRGDFVLKARVARLAWERDANHFALEFQHEPLLMRGAVDAMGSELRPAA